MRTVTFKSVYESIARMHGMDPRGDAVSSDTGLSISDNLNARVQTAWFAWEWPEWTITEERAFRQIWNDSRQFYQVGADGKPDEVFYIPNVATQSLVDAAYYRVKEGAGNPPFGAPPTDTAHWEKMDTVDTYVAFDQICRRRIGEVLDVFANNPAICKPPRQLTHRPSENGIQIYEAGGLATVFVRYLIPAERFTIFPYIASRTYLAGDLVYLAAQGESYKALQVTTGNDPATAYSYWRRCLFPAVLAQYVQLGTYADCLRESDTSDERDPVMLQLRGQRASQAASDAEDEINRQINRLQAQGQNFQYLPFGVVVRRGMHAGSLCTIPGYVLQGGGAYNYGPIAPTGSGQTTLSDQCEGEWTYQVPPPLPLVNVADTGSIQLVNGQSYIDVVFDSPKPSATWVFTELRILNTLDAGPLNIWPGIVTSKSTTGFRLQLNGTPDSNNYLLQWTINEISSAPVPATTYALSGPATGAPGIPSTFTVHLPSSTTVSGIVIVTPDDGGAGGTFAPTSVGLTTAGPSATFTYRPASTGTKTISVTNNGGLIDPPAVSLVAAYATTYVLAGPSGGSVGSPSTNFTVALLAGTSVPGPVTVTPSAGGGGGTFTPTSVTLTTGAPSATFTYTAASIGAKTINTTNSGGLTNPTALTYTAVAPLHLLNTLISYWKLDEASGTRTDSQGTNHLTPSTLRAAALPGPETPEPRVVIGVPGVINNGCQFIYSNGDVLSKSSNSGLQASGDFTFSLWVKLVVPIQSDAGIITKSNEYVISYSAANGFYYYSGAVAANPDVAESHFTPATGAWTHIVAWHDSVTGQAYIRINDSATAQSITAPALLTTAENFAIGAQFNAGTPTVFVNAIVDEVGFWKRKLTTDEITALYNGGAGLPFSSFTT